MDDLFDWTPNRGDVSDCGLCGVLGSHNYARRKRRKAPMMWWKCHACERSAPSAFVAETVGIDDQREGAARCEGARRMDDIEVAVGAVER